MLEASSSRIGLLSPYLSVSPSSPAADTGAGLCSDVRCSNQSHRCLPLNCMFVYFVLVVRLTVVSPHPVRDKFCTCHIPLHALGMEGIHYVSHFLVVITEVDKK